MMINLFLTMTAVLCSSWTFLVLCNDAETLSLIPSYLFYEEKTKAERLKKCKANLQALSSSVPLSLAARLFPRPKMTLGKETIVSESQLSLHSIEIQVKMHS